MRNLIPAFIWIIIGIIIYWFYFAKKADAVAKKLVELDAAKKNYSLFQGKFVDYNNQKINLDRFAWAKYKFHLTMACFIYTLGLLILTLAFKENGVALISSFGIWSAFCCSVFSLSLTGKPFALKELCSVYQNRITKKTYSQNEFNVHLLTVYKNKAVTNRENVQRIIREIRLIAPRNTRKSF